MKALLALSFMALSACASVQPGEGGPTAGLGQVAYTNGLKLRPVAVIEDSRCPALVRCVWAGRLVVRAVVTGHSWQEQRDLELGQPQQIADGTLTLIAAQLQKASPGQADPRAYRFTFDFQGGL